MHNKKIGKFKSVAPKRKVAQITNRFDRHQKMPKNVGITKFLHILRAHEEGQVCIHTWIYWQNMRWEKFPAFLKSHQWCPKTENNHFRVPTHFANNRFTFEKFPPPPPLLHRIMNIHMYICVYVHICISLNMCLHISIHTYV